MNPEELVALIRRRPFQPFRIYMTDQAHYDIYHPEMLMVGARSAIVGTTKTPDQTLYDIPINISLLHIVRTEPIQTATAS